MGATCEHIGPILGDLMTIVVNSARKLVGKDADERRRENTQVTAEHVPDAVALARLFAVFEEVNPENRERIFQTLGTYLGFGRPQSPARPETTRTHQNSVAGFTEDRSMSAKEFLYQKQPSTDVERVACLAFYLTHYQDTPHFKTVDISRLNTEAAQIKFSNAAFTVSNATKLGYLAQAGKGAKQISALGEQFVQALPDREAAKAVMTNLRRRKSSRKEKGVAGD